MERFVSPCLRSLVEVIEARYRVVGVIDFHPDYCQQLPDTVYFGEFSGWPYPAINDTPTRIMNHDVIDCDVFSSYRLAVFDLWKRVSARCVGGDVLFWRIYPEINSTFDYDLGMRLFRGYCRIGDFLNTRKED